MRKFVILIITLFPIMLLSQGARHIWESHGKKTITNTGTDSLLVVLLDQNSLGSSNEWKKEDLFTGAASLYFYTELVSGTLGNYTLSYKRLDINYDTEDTATTIVSDTAAVDGGFTIWGINTSIPIIGYMLYITRTTPASGSAIFYPFTLRQEYIRPQ